MFSTSYAHKMKLIMFIILKKNLNASTFIILRESEMIIFQNLGI